MFRAGPESLELTIEGIEARQEGGSWISFQVEPLIVDLAELSAEELVVAASGELSPGDYTDVRFLVSDATIVFSEDVTVGGDTFVGEQAYELEIPDGGKGLKVPTAHCTMGDEGGEVLVYLDPFESSASMALTRAGKLLMRLLLYEADSDTEEAVTKILDDLYQGRVCRRVSLPPRRTLALPVFKHRVAMSMVTFGRAS